MVRQKAGPAQIARKPGEIFMTRRLLPRFTPKTLGVSITILCILSAWVASLARQAQVQQQAVLAIEADGYNSLWYDYQCNELGQDVSAYWWDDQKEEEIPPPSPAWLRRIVGMHFMHSVHAAWIRTRNGLDHVFDLPQLRGLTLQKLKLTQHDADKLSRAHKLRSLQFQDVSADNQVDLALALKALLQGLRSLGLSGLEVDDSLLKYLNNAVNLEVLAVPYTTITDDTLEKIPDIRTLRRLDLTGTKVTDAGLPYAGKLIALEDLQLGGTVISNDGLKHLQHHPSLSYLNLVSTNITDEGLAHISSIRNLKSLALSSTQVTDAGFAHLVKLKRLKNLFLKGTRVSADGVERFRKALPTCNVDWNEK
jgi:hypothetical protein